MPNWCENTINIENITEEQTVRIVKACDEGKLLAEFWPEPDYTVTPVAKTYPQIGVQFAKTEEEKEKIMRNEPTIRQDSWWDWRVQHWGTKWDADEIYHDYREEEQSLSISFLSAWSPPSEAWLKKLMEVYPDIRITHSYQEPGCDFAGVTVATKNGVSDICVNISDVMEKWLRKTYDEDVVSKYLDSNHPDHDETYEEVFEDWQNVQYQVLDEALGVMTKIADSKLEAA